MRAKMGDGGEKKGGRGRKRSRKARRGKNGRRRGRQDEIPEADVVSDDGGSGDGGDVCEVLMFDRGDGTYSLKFIQNKCQKRRSGNIQKYFGKYFWCHDKSSRAFAESIQTTTNPPW